ncbi:MAG: acyltransferase [Candidatus Magasanikiibacteriota bacterium]
MQIEVLNPILQTQIFSLVFVLAILVSIRKNQDQDFFPISLTNELKGFSILAIVFSHIGYSLSVDTRFLFPLSVLAGVGVNLFLFLSGYGLAVSAMKKTLSPIQFYLKRIIKIFIPLWIILISLFILDWLVLHRSYPIAEIWQSLFGFFKQADLAGNVNSPLWFITIILFYYLVFPWFFKKEHPFLSAFLLFFSGYFVVNYGFEIIWRVEYLYRLHYMALPLGVFFAGVVSSKVVGEYVQKILASLFVKQWLKVFSLILLASIFLTAFLYFAIHSGVNQDPRSEQFISNITMLLIVGLFLMKPFGVKFFSLVGIYSYEIYLLHWPLMYRYDIFYIWLPAGVATVCYIGLFILLGFGLQKLTGLITNLTKV